MALADYFPRDALAISQVLQGFETDAFTERLEGVRVAIAFDEEAATTRDGRSLLDLTVRLAARLYPSLTFLTIPAADNFAEELMALARAGAIPPLPIDERPLAEAQTALDDLRARAVLGRVVLRP